MCERFDSQILQGVGLHREAPVRRVREVRLVDQVSSVIDGITKVFCKIWQGEQALSTTPLSCRTLVAWSQSHRLGYMQGTCHVPLPLTMPATLCTGSPCGPAAARRAGPVSTAPCARAPRCQPIGTHCSARFQRHVHPPHRLAGGGVGGGGHHHPSPARARRHPDPARQPPGCPASPGSGLRVTSGCLCPPRRRRRRGGQFNGPPLPCHGGGRERGARDRLVDHRPCP
jgi:hypothetical protein